MFLENTLLQGNSIFLLAVFFFYLHIFLFIFLSIFATLFISSLCFLITLFSLSSLTLALYDTHTHTFFLSPSSVTCPLTHQHQLLYSSFTSPTLTLTPTLSLSSSHLEIQQRACEYLALPSVGQEIMEAVMNSMPPYLDKGNALLSLHEVCESDSNSI